MHVTYLNSASMWGRTAGRWLLSSRPTLRFSPSHSLPLGVNDSALRFFSSSKNKREDHKFTVKPFGSFCLKTQACDIDIKSLDPHKYINQDRSFLQFDSEVQHDCVYEETHDQQGSLAVTSSGRCSQEGTGSFLASIPVKYDLDVAVQGSGSVTLGTFENDSIKVQVDQGHCNLNNIKSHDVVVDVKGGNIISKSTLLGHVTARTQGKGRISAKKVLGQSCELETERGEIDLRNLYADNTKLTTQSADISLGNCHRNVAVKIAEKGNLTIDSMDGNLEAEVAEGDISVYVSAHEHVHIHTGKGDITVKMAESCQTQLDLQATTIDISPEISTQGELSQNGTAYTGCIGSGDVKAGTMRLSTGEGHIKLLYQDWFTSLNLKLKTGV